MIPWDDDLDICVKEEVYLHTYRSKPEIKLSFMEVEVKKMIAGKNQIETYLDQDEPLLKNVGDMLEANGLCLVIDYGDDDDYDDG